MTDLVSQMSQILGGFGVATESDLVMSPMHFISVCPFDSLINSYVAVIHDYGFIGVM